MTYKDHLDIIIFDIINNNPIYIQMSVVVFQSLNIYINIY